MNHLDHKSIWLFFFRYLEGILIITGIFLIIMAPKVFVNNVMKRIGEGSSLHFGWLIAWGSIGFWLCILFAYIWAQLTYKYWRYQLTEDVIKIERGVIFKKYISIPYSRIQNVDIYRGLLSRMLGLSDLQIQTAGYSGLPYRSSLMGSFGGAEGILPALNPQVAERLREELVQKAKNSRQGL